MRIKKLLLATTALLALTITPLYLMPGSAAAVNIFGNSCTASDNSSAVCTDVNSQKRSTTNPIIRIIKAAINVVSILIGVAAILVLIISGIRMVTANGDSQGVARARSGILYALIGLIIAALAEAIVGFVLNKVG